MSTKKPTGSRTAILVRYRPLVRRLAVQLHGRLPKSVELAELENVGFVGLLESVERYDPGRGVPFQPYASHRIRGAMLDHLRALDWVPHSTRRKAQRLAHAHRALYAGTGRRPSDREMAKRLGIELPAYRDLVRDAEIRQLLSLDAPAANDNPTPLVEQVASAVDVERMTFANQLNAIVVEAVGRLPEREALAITLYYLQGYSLREVGEQLGVTESRACQLAGQGVRRLRRKLNRLV